MKGFHKTSPNTQVVGFCDQDGHSEVLRKGARGLGLTCSLSNLQLLCSNGIVLDSPLGEKSWMLGEYIRQNGGTQNRSKRVWGICIPVDEYENSSEDLVSIARY